MSTEFTMRVSRPLQGRGSFVGSLYSLSEKKAHFIFESVFCTPTPPEWYREKRWHLHICCIVRENTEAHRVLREPGSFLSFIISTKDICLLLLLKTLTPSSMPQADLPWALEVEAVFSKTASYKYILENSPEEKQPVPLIARHAGTWEAVEKSLQQAVRSLVLVTALSVHHTTVEEKGETYITLVVYELGVLLPSACCMNSGLVLTAPSDVHLPVWKASAGLSSSLSTPVHSRCLFQ